MDALTWFKSAFHHAQATPAPVRADVASERWPEVPLHVAAARLRPPSPAADDEDWNAVIARAKIQAASAKPPSPLPPPLPRNVPSRAPSPPPPRPRRNEWAEMPATPPPVPALPPPTRSTAPTQATLDGLVSRGLHKPAALRPVSASRRPVPGPLATPLPLSKALRAAGLFSGPAKRP